MAQDVRRYGDWLLFPNFPQYLPDLFTALSTASVLFAATMAQPAKSGDIDP
jgi:hypothetical protein